MVSVSGVGALVRQRRRALGLNQTELGRRAGGLTQDYISKLESGIIDTPQRGTMDALATALDVPVSALYRAAGILEGVPDVEPPAPPTPPMDTLWPDSPHLTVAEMVEDIERRRGAWYQGELDEARQELSREEYEDFCVQLWRMFEGNSLMAFGNRKRGR